MKATNKSALNSTELLLKELDNLQKEEDIVQDFSFVKDLLHSLMDESQRKAGILVRILQPLLFKYPMESLDFDDNIKMAHAVIFEPIGNNDTPLKYTAGKNFDFFFMGYYVHTYLILYLDITYKCYKSILYFSR